MKIRNDSPPLRAYRTRIAARIWTGLALVISLMSLLLVLVSFRLRFESVQSQLVQLYGQDRTSRYFTPGVFHLFTERIRLGAGVLVTIAFIILALRGPLVRVLVSFWHALSLSIRHERRACRKWGPAAGAVIAMTLIGLFVRLRFINQPMRYDESATVLGYASKPFYIGLSIYNEPNNHLFHTLLVHISIALLGSAAWAVRLPALIAGTLLCPLTYAAARRFSNSMAALLAAAFVSASSILIEYSTNARGYTLVCCATLALLVAGFETLRRASPYWFLLFGLTAFLGFWTIPIFLFPYGGLILWIAFESLGKARRLRRVFWTRLIVTNIIAGGATILAYTLPMTTGPKVLFGNQWMAPRNVQALLAGNLVQLRLTGHLGCGTCRSGGLGSWCWRSFCP